MAHNGHGTVLAGERCRLRPFETGDAAALVALADDARVVRWLSRRFPHPYTRIDAEAYLTFTTQDGPMLAFAVEVDGGLAGGAVVEPLGGDRMGTWMLGYWLGTAFWGRGIATEAIRLIVRHVLRERPIRRLEATVFGPNVASGRVLEKCGFMREGVLRERYVDRAGTVCDEIVYALLASGGAPASSGGT